MAKVRATGAAGANEASPACDAVMVQLPAETMCIAPPAPTVHSPAAA